jgi:CRISPR associated protein Cas1/Short repeat of unknown function (DUF308)
MGPERLTTGIEEVRKHSTWFLLIGIALIVVGTIAIVFAVATTISSMIFFGWLLIIGGVFEVIHGIARRRWSGFSEHWLTFGKRYSLLSKPSPRRAVNPANAILNYLYAIIEAEAQIAALRMGLDPGLGLLHADQRTRNSLPCDSMEPVRPRIDA